MHTRVRVDVGLFCVFIALYVVLGVPLLSLLITIIDNTGPYFYIYLSVALFCIQLLAVLIYPTFIQPCFNKVEPLAEGGRQTFSHTLISTHTAQHAHFYIMLCVCVCVCVCV